jgi:small subunit ribosomal protein S16
MPIKIRLSRTGKKKQPYYRLVVADSRSKRDGQFLEQVGSYNPRSDPVELKLATDRVIHWLEKGALPTETVARLLKSQGLMLGGQGPSVKSGVDSSKDSPEGTA